MEVQDGLEKQQPPFSWHESGVFYFLGLRQDLMSNITLEVYEEKDLAIFTAEGSITVQDVCDSIDSYYSGPIMSLILWDATRLDLAPWQKDDILSAVRKVKAYSHLRVGGRSALVFPRDLNFGLAKMFQAYSEVDNLQIEVEVFRNIEEAIEWLGRSSAQIRES